MVFIRTAGYKLTVNFLSAAESKAEELSALSLLPLLKRLFIAAEFDELSSLLSI
jgi:hypothetical protein